ncbi:uncharacterized protein (DUF1684 family) [Agrococcus sp. UYP33]
MTDSQVDDAADLDDAAQFEEAWRRWQAVRWRTVAGPHGIAALAATVWLSDADQAVDGVEGRWRADGDLVVGTGLQASGYRHRDGSEVADTVTLHAGETLVAGDVLLRAFVREGIPALRRIDPHTDRRVRLREIATHRPDPAWVVAARWTPNDEPLEVEAVDGHRTTRSDAGTLAFELGGRERSLIATRGDGELAVVFADAAGDEQYPFRFLRPRLPDEHGVTTLDFNRAFLPPCAFSDHYVCPMPPPGNRLDLRVCVGERMPVYDDVR